MVPFARGTCGLIVPVGLCLIGGLSANRNVPSAKWDPKLAANYLDFRNNAWTRGGAMERGTFCISCHTALPYALARPVMRTALGEKQASLVEQILLDSVTKRVRTWDTVQPYLGDKRGGLGTESVLNALILAQDDARAGRLTDTTRQALTIMWSQQIKSGDRAGSWPWISAGNEPWEAPDSDYWGATLAAVATGTAPEGYASMPQIQGDLKLLKEYLRNEEAGKSLLNRLGLLLANTKLPGLISPDRRAAIVADALTRQRPDGGWSTASLIPSTWKRRDGTAQDSSSDGYGTGIVTYVLEEAGVGRSRPEIRKSLSWLMANQDRSTGAWPTVSPNVKRDVSSDAGKFMTDAATAYAVLALAGAR